MKQLPVKDQLRFLRMAIETHLESFKMSRRFQQQYGDAPLVVEWYAKKIQQAHEDLQMVRALYEREP